MAGIAVINPRRRKRGRESARRRYSRNPKGKQMLKGMLNALKHDAKNAAPVLGGTYVAQFLGAAGGRYLSAVPAGLGGTVAQVAGTLAIGRFVKGHAAEYIRAGIMGQAINDLLVSQFGLDPAGMLIDLLPQPEMAPAAAPQTTATPGAAGFQTPIVGGGNGYRLGSFVKDWNMRLAPASPYHTY